MRLTGAMLLIFTFFWSVFVCWGCQSKEKLKAERIAEEARGAVQELFFKDGKMPDDDELRQATSKRIELPTGYDVHAVREASTPNRVAFKVSVIYKGEMVYGWHDSFPNFGSAK